jgi:hypothetical protein
MKSEKCDFIATDEMDKQLFETACKVTNEKTEILEMVEGFKEELKTLNRAINISIKNPQLSNYYFEYVRLGGKSEKKQFKKHLKRFFELTLNIYVYGSCLNIDGTYCDGRNDANIRWIQYIDSYEEAKLYMKTVDNITPYS